MPPAQSRTVHPPAELSVRPRGVPSFARLIALEMLTISSNGRERTEREFADLFAKAGLSLARIVPMQSPYSVLEARLG